MVSVTVLSAIRSGEPIIAAPVTYNFSAISTAINSSALNSQNYRASGIYSQNIVSNAIVSQHFSAISISGNKIGSYAVQHTNLLINSGTNPVQVLRIGVSASDLPAYGKRMAVLTKSVEVTTQQNSISFAFTNAIHGAASFTASAFPLGPPVAVMQDSSQQFGYDKMKLYSVNSTGATFHFLGHTSAGVSETITFHLAVVGAASTQ